MHLLAFESSAKSASVALLRDGVLVAEYMQNSGQTHSRTLLKMAEDLLNNCDLTIEDVDAVAAAIGPGSFTGLRIGLAAAKGLAWGRQIPCVGVSTLEAMARSAAMADGIYVCCMDARRQQVYNAVFSVAGGKLLRLREDRAISIEELEQDLASLSGALILVGDGAGLCHSTMNENSRLILAPEHMRMQRASGVALAALEQLKEGTVPPVGEVTLNYLRLSQAERERALRLEQEGGK